MKFQSLKLKPGGGGGSGTLPNFTQTEEDELYSLLVAVKKDKNGKVRCVARLFPGTVRIKKGETLLAVETVLIPKIKPVFSRIYPPKFKKEKQSCRK
ncbi:MAG: hypothetical protein AB7F19_07880 [Candidatus Babeliales bacterium]